MMPRGVSFRRGAESERLSSDQRSAAVVVESNSLICGPSYNNITSRRTLAGFSPAAQICILSFTSAVQVTTRDINRIISIMATDDKPKVVLHW